MKGVTCLKLQISLKPTIQVLVPHLPALAKSATLRLLNSNKHLFSRKTSNTIFSRYTRDSHSENIHLHVNLNFGIQV